ncbi:hypothetical protein [Pseudoxanthomonas sp. LARHCG66]
MDVRRMPRWAAVAAGCAMACSPDAWAGKSVAECQAFAHQSLDMKRDALARNCGFPDNWIGTWQQNFDYCRSAEASSTDQIVHRRNVMMNMCTNVCPGYAAAAMNDIRIATEGGCLQGNTLVGVTGGAGRWAGDYATHFRWCMSGPSLGTIDRERRIRATEAPRCGICGRYADTTVQQAQVQQQKRCGYGSFHGGHQWSLERGLHFSHCMGHPIDRVQAWANAQTNDRANLLNRCPSLQTQATCRFYAQRAAQQRAALDNVRFTCDFQGLDHSRWNPDEQVHFEGCLSNPQTTPGEDQAREQHLVACGASRKASPPVVPLDPGKTCRFGAVTTLVECLDPRGVPVANWDPPLMEPACGLGSTAEEAEDNALLAYRVAHGLTVTENPGNGECSYEATPINGCSCDTGLAIRSLRFRQGPAIQVRQPIVPRVQPDPANTLHPRVLEPRREPRPDELIEPGRIEPQPQP